MLIQYLFKRPSPGPEVLQPDKVINSQRLDVPTYLIFRK